MSNKHIKRCSIAIREIIGETQITTTVIPSHIDSDPIAIVRERERVGGRKLLLVRMRSN